MPKKSTVLPDARKIETLLSLVQLPKKHIGFDADISPRTLFTIQAGRTEVGRESLRALAQAINASGNISTSINELIAGPGPLLGFPPLASDFVPLHNIVHPIEATLVENWHPRTSKAPPLGAQKYFLCGSPGTGKSTSSIYLAQSQRIRTRYSDGLIFLHCGPNPDPTQLQETLLRQVVEPARLESRALGESLSQFRKELAEKHLLIVLDDVRHAQLIEALDFGTTMLISTQRRDIAESYTSTPFLMEHHSPTTDEALSILKKAAGIKRLSQDLRDCCLDVIRLCGHHPYALHTVGRIKRYHDISWASIQHHLKSESENVTVPFRKGYEHGTIDSPFLAATQVLPKRVHERFKQLSVAPESTVITEAFLRLLWGDSSVNQPVATTLQTLLDASLIFETTPPAPSSKSYRLHNLVYGFLLTLNPPQAEDHQRIVNHYQQELADGSFTAIKDSYFFLNYAHHLAKSGWTERLRQTLFDIHWMLEQVRHTGNINALCRDLTLIDTPTHEILLKALSLSAKTIHRAPEQLPLQIYNRTCHLSTSDPLLAQLHQDILAMRASFPLWPVKQSLLTPSNQILSTILTEHAHVESLCVFADLLVSGGESFGTDNHLLTWQITRHGSATNLSSVSRVSLGYDSATALTTSSHLPQAIVGTKKGRIALFDPLTDSLTFVNEGHQRRVSCLTELSSFLISGGDDGTIRLWNLDTRTHLDTITLQAPIVTSLASAPSSGTIAVAYGNTLGFYEIKYNRLREIARHPFSEVRQITALSPTSRATTWIAATCDGEIIRYDLESGSEHRIKGHQKNVLCLLHHPDTHSVISSSRDSSVKIWREDDLDHPPGIIGRDEGRPVKVIAREATHTTLFAGNTFGEIKALSLDLGEGIDQSLGHHDSPIVSFLTLSPDHLPISLSRSGQLFEWQASKTLIASRFNLGLASDEFVTCAAVSNIENCIYIGTSSGRIDSVHRPDYRAGSSYQVSSSAITAIAMSETERVILVASQDGWIRAIRNDDSIANIVSVDTVVPTTLVQSPSGAWLSGWNDGKIIVIPSHAPPTANSPFLSLSIHHQAISCLCPHGNGTIACSSLAGKIVILDSDTLMPRSTALSHRDRITHLQSLNEDLLLAADDSGQANIWDTENAVVTARYFGDFRFTTTGKSQQKVFLGDTYGFVHVLEINESGLQTTSV